jgi:hypothetical protein
MTFNFLFVYLISRIFFGHLVGLNERGQQFRGLKKTNFFYAVDYGFLFFGGVTELSLVSFCVLELIVRTQFIAYFSGDKCILFCWKVRHLFLTTGGCVVVLFLTQRYEQTSPLNMDAL